VTWTTDAAMHESLFGHFSNVAGLTDDVGYSGQSGLTADIAETTQMDP